MQDNSKLLGQLAGLIQRLEDDHYNATDLMRVILSNLNSGEQDLSLREITDTKHLRLYCELFRSTNQVTTTGAFPFISFDTVNYNYGNMWDKNNPTYITIPYSGRYIIDVGIVFESNAVGIRQALISNITTGRFLKAPLLAATAGGINTQFSVTSMSYLTAGDRIGIQVNQNSGGNLNVLSGADYSPVMRVHGLCDLS